MRGERERGYISYHSTGSQSTRLTLHCSFCTWWGCHVVLEDNTELSRKSLNPCVFRCWETLEFDWFRKNRETEATITGHTTCHYPQLWRIDTLEGRGENWTNTGGWRYGHREEHILCVTVIISSSHTTVIHVQTSRRRSMPTLRLLRMDIVVEDEFLRRSWGWSCNYCKCSWSLTLIRDKGFRVCLLFGFLRGWDSVTVSLHNVHSNGMWE